MKKILLLSSFLLFPLNLSFACAVCFGGAGANLVKGFTWGVALLMALPFGLMGGLAGLIIFTMKKNRIHE